MIQLGLLGYPLDHSLSPKIHQSALHACGIQGSYSLFPIAPESQSEIKDLLRRIRTGDILGINVTIPFKETVIPLLDKLTPTAESIGAVNTIFLDHGTLTGDNTDAPGFITDLYHQFDLSHYRPNPSRTALVLGAGGSARAVTYALINDGWQVTLSSRRPDQAKALVSQFPKHMNRLSVCQYSIDVLEPLVSSFDLVVNTTPVGMAPSIDATPWLTGLSFPRHAFVYDLVYNPRETKLTLDSRSAGLRAVTGLGMLVEQAALAFNIWTGQDVPRSVLLEKME